MPQVFPSCGAGGPSTISLPAALNSHLPIPYSEQYNLTIEREQWNTGFRISYVGTDSRQDTFSYNINAPTPNAQTFVSKTRPFPNYPAINYDTNGAYHEFNGLTMQATRQMKGGLYYQAAWTWARDMGNYDWGGSGYNTVEDPFNFQRDKGPDQYQPTNRFTGALMYWLPFGHGRHWLSGTSKALNEAVGGWQLSGIWTVQSAQHLTPQWSGADPVGITYTTGSPAQVTIRPNVNGNPNSGGQGTIRRWFNTSVFSAPTPGQFGNAGRGIINGPGVNVLDAGLMKEFYLHGGETGPRLQLQLTATNFANHPNWSNPDVNVSDGSSFGTISGVGGVNGGSVGDVPGPRAFQLLMQVVW